jgi:ribonuclease VapC
VTVAVLDASALLAMLRGEPGGSRVAAVLDDSAISVINLGEVIGHYARIGAPAPEIHRMLDPLPVQRVPFDEDFAYSVGLLLPATRAAGLSFADRACLALARRFGVKALTADRVWSRIATAVQVEIEMIR